MTTTNNVSFSEPQRSDDLVRVAGVGSPSSSSEITLDLTSVGRNTKLVGATVAVLNNLGDNGEELGLGTVTEVITHNKWHQDSSFRGARNDEGVLEGFSGDLGDQRVATIRIQASWYRSNPDERWISSGTQLGMSPATGTSVYLINQKTVNEITESYSDLHYNGELGGSEGIPLPLNIPDNSTPQGALHYGVFGRSGSGKALCLNTPIPTPSGWKTMKDLQPGDALFTESGELCMVTEVHPIQYDKNCYNVVFSDGEMITADGEHLWSVNITTPNGHINRGIVMTTEEIATELTHKVETVDERSNVTTPLTEDETVIGDQNDNIITGGEKVETQLRHATVTVDTPHRIHFFPLKNEKSGEVSVENLEDAEQEGINSIYLLNSGKMLESEMYELYDKYIRSENGTREAFLRGLLEENGNYHPTNVNGERGYYRSNNYLHAKLTSTLLILEGKTPHLTIEPLDVCLPTPEMVKRFTTPNFEPEISSTFETFYFITWSDNVNRERSIVAVKKTETVPVRCITVDSPTRLYLAGRTFIPTHNTASACYTLAGQLRHSQMGMVIIDPQGQWAAEHSLPFSFQGFAEELGREVTVARVSEDLRLREDATLLKELLDQTRFYNKLRIKHAQTQDLAGEEINDILNGIESWSDMESGDLLREILKGLGSESVASRIYTTDAKKERFQETIHGLLDSSKDFNLLYSQFHPIANLFQKFNSSGGKRISFWSVLANVFEKKHDTPAPLLIVDMSSKPPESSSGESLSMEVESSYLILDNDGMKAAILRNLFSNLKRASEEKFRKGDNLNTMIVLDEAWRYAAPLSRISGDEEEMSSLSKDLAGYARDTRKFGISWFYISQSPRSINQDIWEQIHIFMFGTGLNGLDLEKATEAYEDKAAALRLYKRFGNPIMTGVWPFLLQGPVSPLMSANAPLVLNMYTKFDDFREDNKKWIKNHRDVLGKPTLTGDPAPPKEKTIKKGHVKRVPKSVEETLDIIRKEETHRKEMGEVGLKNPEGFTDPLSQL